ncbi:MAG TPA: coenzyme F420-0:L-glutamate ligase [Anaerolineaceae bacterium]|nr:coenzyme F420-0:L-glutamate ligase [Anaerolineaceae bacterium]
MTLQITPLTGLPLIQSGDPLASFIFHSTQAAGITLQEGDIFILAQKIVSKAEGRLVNLCQVSPSPEAVHIARQTEKDPRFVELVLQESRSILRTRPGALIVEHRLGFVCANAGIDHSNVGGLDGDPDDWVLLLPLDPDGSAGNIRRELESSAGLGLGVMVIDTHGRAWRNGVVGACIGLSGIPGVVDMRGRLDLFGYSLRITQIAVADELAAAASLVMGQAAEGIPVVHVRGFPYPLREGSLTELIRPKEQDLFR